MITSSKGYLALGYRQERENLPFAPSQQDGRVSLAVNYPSSAVNAVWGQEATLPQGSSVDIDLDSLVDFLNDPVQLTRIYAFQLSSADANLILSPGASTPQHLFLQNNSSVEVKAGSTVSYLSRGWLAASPSSKRITLTNPSATTDLVYKITILGLSEPGGTTTSTTSRDRKSVV